MYKCATPLAHLGSILTSQIVIGSYLEYIALGESSFPEIQSMSMVGCWFPHWVESKIVLRTHSPFEDKPFCLALELDLLAINLHSPKCSSWVIDHSIFIVAEAWEFEEANSLSTLQLTWERCQVILSFTLFSLLLLASLPREVSQSMPWLRMQSP
jgi:hypothetical protein